MAAKLIPAVRLRSFGSRLRFLKPWLPNLNSGTGPRAWKRFRLAVTEDRRPLLSKLSDLPGPVLVTGCQRSGTTILASALFRCHELFDYRAGGDSELEGAQILCGLRPYPGSGRTVFQTTYVNTDPEEYKSMPSDGRLIWMIRRPESVVYSMLHNWHRAALNRLFLSCGTLCLSDEERSRLLRFGVWAIRPLVRACAAYVGKNAQIDYLRPLLEERLLIVDYDTLVENRVAQLGLVTSFANLSLPGDSDKLLNTRSTLKAAALSEEERSYVEFRCGPTYRLIRSLVRSLPEAQYET